MPRATVDPRFGEKLRRLREQRGLSLRELAAVVLSSKSHLHDFENGRKRPTADTAARLDEALNAHGELAALVNVGAPPVRPGDDELDALELSRRVAASDVSSETLQRLSAAVDELAMAYTTTPPAELQPRVRRHLAYVGQLVGARKTLAQQRHLLVAGAWLSLLGATVDIDLRHRAAAAARLATAWQMAEHVDHTEIQAWCLETRAWEILTEGRYRPALDLARQARALAPHGSSAHIQATAQEGRALARMGQRAETRKALDEVSRLVGPMGTPERPEHHYQYDPAKALSYTATTLAWMGDPAAEEYARTVIVELEAPGTLTRPRRIASARLDLGLALLAADRPDEAKAVTMEAITSGKVVPSNWWRAVEVVVGVERAGLAGADELRDAERTLRPAPASADVADS